MSAPAPPPAWGSPPVPPLRPEEERTWAVLVHLLPLLGLGLLAPLVVWLVFRGRGPFLEHHAKESLNLQLTVLIAVVVGTLLSLATFGVAALVVVVAGAVWVVLEILAAVAASRWEWYRYPLVLRLIP